MKIDLDWTRCLAIFMKHPSEGSSSILLKGQGMANAKSQNIRGADTKLTQFLIIIH